MGFDLFGTIAKGVGIGSGPDTSQFMGPKYSNLSTFGANPYSSSLSGSLSSMPQFQPISAPGSTYTSSGPYKQDAYQAKDMSKTALPQYDAMRERLNSQYSQQQGQSQDALDRQFAAMGGGPGNGAQAKQTENLSAGIAKQKGDDLLGINAEEAQARTALQQQEEQKAFQSGETEKGYGFQAGQSDIGRQFQAGQTASQMGMQAGMFNQQMQQSQNQFNFNAGTTLAGLNTAWDQAQAEANNNEFNKALAQYQSQHSGGLLGGGGFLGTGIGA